MSHRHASLPTRAIGIAPNKHAAARHNGRLHFVPAEITAGGIPISYRAHIDDGAPLARYRRRGMISERQFEAGAQVARLFNRAVKSPKVTMDWGDRISGGGRLDADEFAAATAADGRGALYSALRGAGLARPVADGEGVGVGLTPLGSLILSVCGHEEFAGGTRRLNRLRHGLDALADFFKLVDPLVASGRHRIGKYIAPGPSPTDDPTARDLSWADSQNQKRATIASKRAKKARSHASSKEGSDQ